MRRAMEVVGDRWSLLIVNEALVGPRRFSHFKKSVGIAPNILSERLVRLAELGIITTEPIKEGSPNRVYMLTQRGEGLRMVIAAMCRWESEFQFI